MADETVRDLARRVAAEPDDARAREQLAIARKRAGSDRPPWAFQCGMRYGKTHLTTHWVADHMGVPCPLCAERERITRVNPLVVALAHLKQVKELRRG